MKEKIINNIICPITLIAYVFSILILSGFISSNIIRFLFQLIISSISIHYFYFLLGCKISNFDELKTEMKIIAKELFMFIPIFIICTLFRTFVIVGTPKNQLELEEIFTQISPVMFFIICVIICPIEEEFICRFLPYNFIKNKLFYIIISAVVFAGIHVVDDPNPLYYITAYMINALYYGYRYSKTKNLLVTISLHSFNNLIGFICMIMAL